MSDSEPAPADTPPGPEPILVSNNPCPCLPLKYATKIIASLEIIVNALLLIIATILIVSIRKDIDKEKANWKTVILFNILIFPLVCQPIFCLSFDTLLLVGVAHLSRWKCCVYLIGTSINHLVQFILVIGLRIAIAINQKDVEMHGIEHVMEATIVYLLVSVYFKIVVDGFMTAMRLNEANRQAPVPSESPQEIQLSPEQEGDANA